MARERSIVVRLRAEISDFQNQMGQASRSLSDFEKGQQKLGGAATTTMGRLVQSAKINEQQWTNVGRTLTAAGAGMAAIGGAALKTGIDYNNLRQTATKSLESVTGSTEAAAAQMRRLDDYGQNSWLMRDVLVRAQQNMSGFGIETGKVVPYMDALAEAVAGTTGSQQNFEELAQVMGKIQSQGKITARELNEFGLRGIDAAQLIGDAMGKTADQIRSEITAGTLDAETALDALAEGMSTKFEGSSDRMRDTFQGAVDNLKGAWRDLSADMAKPLVDPEGGGALVGLTNTLADFLNSLQALPGPVKGAIGVIGGLTTAATVGAGAFALLMPKYVQFRESLADLTSYHPKLGKFASGLGNVAVAAGKLGGVVGLTAVGVSSLLSAFKNEADFHGINELTNNLEELAEAGKTAAEIDLSSIVSEMPELFGITTIEAENLGDVLDTLLNPDMTDKFVNFFGDSMPTYMRDNRQIAEELDEALVHMLNAGGSEEAAAVQFMENLGYSSAELKEVLPGASDALVAVKDAASGAAGPSDELVGALEEVGIAADGTVDSLSAYLDLLFETGLAVMSERDAHARYQESLDGVSDAIDQIVAEHGGLSAALNDSATDFDLTTEAGRTAQGAFHDIAQSGMDAAEAMAENGASQQTVQDALQGTYNDLINAAEQFGITGTAAEELASEVLGIPDDVDIETWLEDTAKEKAEELAEKIDGVPDVINVEADADTGPADERINFLLNRFDEEKPNPLIVDADTTPADGRVDFLMNKWGGTTTDTNVDANTAPAAGTTTSLFNQWRSTTTDTNVDANTGPAIGTTTGLYNSIAGTTTNTNVDANTSPAAGTTQGLYNEIAGTTTSTNVDANTQPARNAITNLRNWFAGQEFTKTVNIIEKKGGKFHGGWVTPGRYEGGLIDIARTVPGRKAGGWVPGERAGYDNVMWPLHSGGQVLNQPLEGREFVVNSRDAARYPAELNAMNNGTYPTNTLERAYSPTQQIDYQKLATALRGREHIEQHMHLHTANATITEGIDGFNRMNMAESRR